MRKLGTTREKKFVGFLSNKPPCPLRISLVCVSVFKGCCMNEHSAFRIQKKTAAPVCMKTRATVLCIKCHCFGNSKPGALARRH